MKLYMKLSSLVYFDKLLHALLPGTDMHLFFKHVCTHTCLYMYVCTTHDITCFVLIYLFMFVQ